MSLLERVIVAHRCRSTHHYIAMDALGQISGPDAEKWKDLILVHNEEYLKGAKAPDAVFKDFKNHVLHIQEGEWGGARQAALAWYGEAVNYLKAKKWDKAVYALGVLSHYYADPIQPFHTGQTEEEGAIHRAVEWSIAKSRETIKARVEEIGYPVVEVGAGPCFVSDMVRAGAEKSNPHYQTLLDHYDVHAGTKNPPAGLDQTLIEVIAELVAYATAGLGVIFARAFAEAGVAAPKVHISLPGYLSTLDIPIYWVAKKLDDVADRRTVTKMYKEFQKTGKVIKALPDDDKEIRKAHARQVLRKPVKELDAEPLKPLGTKHLPRPEFAPALEEEVIADPDITETQEATDIEPAQEVTSAEPEVVSPEEEMAVEEAHLETDDAGHQTEQDYLEVESAAELARLETQEQAEENTHLESDVETVEKEALSTEETFAEDDPSTEFTLEELASFETNLTDTEPEMVPIPDEDMHEETVDTSVVLVEEVNQDEAPPVENFFEERSASDRQSSRTLDLDAPVVDAPSIGKKTARRLNRVGIETVENLLECDAEEIAFELDVRHITEDTLEDWIAQARLMVEVPGLRAHDTQVLVGAGIRSADDLAAASVTDVFKASMNFLATSKGAYIAHHNYELEEEKIEDWVERAKDVQVA